MRELLLALPHRQSRWLLLIAALAGTGLVASGFLLPLFSQLFTDHYLVAGHRDWLGGLLLGMALATLLRAALTWLQRRLLLRIQLAAARALNRSTFTALLNVEPQALTHLALGSSGFLLRRQQRALALLYNEVAQGFADLPAVPVLLLVMLWFDPLLAGLACALTSLNALAYRLVARQRARLGSAAGSAGARVATLVEQDLARLPAIRAGVAENATEQTWLAAYRRQAGATRKLALLGQLLTAVPQTLAGLSGAALLAAGALRIIDGAISVGELVACQTLLFGINDAFQRFIEASRLYPEVVADLQRHQDLLTLPRRSAAADAAVVDALAPAPTEHITISGVYADLPLQLELPAAAQLALPADAPADVHRLCRALAGSGEIADLSIYFDNVPIPILNTAGRQTAIVLIDSRGSALDDSLRENIRLWDQDSDDEACAQALYLAGFEEALQLPDGLDTALGRRELSNGQLRRVLLARALLHRPHLLVLDDALEALDLPLVRRILQRLKQSGITLIITSPRADVLSLCDWRLQVAAGGWQLDNYR